MAKESLSFDLRGKNVALVRIDKDGKKSEFILPTSAVLSLPKIVRETIHKILAQRATQPALQPGTLPIAAFPVAGVGLNVDPIRHELLLTIDDAYGNQSTFALPLDVAQKLATRIPVRVAELTQAASGQKPH